VKRIGAARRGPVGPVGRIHLSMIVMGVKLTCFPVDCHQHGAGRQRQS